MGTEHISVKKLLEAVLPLGLLSQPTSLILYSEAINFSFGLTWIACVQKSPLLQEKSGEETSVNRRR